MAAHYGTAVIPARPYKPRDKAKVEVGVQVVQRWILARLRQNAVVEDADFRTPRGLDRALFHTLAGCEWIRRSQHLVISGPSESAT
jgi:transposase